MKTGNAIGAMLFLTLPLWGQEQQYESRKPSATDAAVCYGKNTNEHTYVAPPSAFTEWKTNSTARIKTANFVVTYVDFSPEAKAAFQAAVDIWATLITSDITIRIKATWEPLSAGVLGSASAGTFYRDFPGAQRQRTWYPVALAEKISGKELNGADADIEASFNSNNSSWYYGTSGGAPSGTYDLVSIVLHEIGHGLGINHNYSVSGTNALVSGDLVFAYSTYIENANAQNIVTGFSQPSADLKTQLTSKNLFFNSPTVLKDNANTKAKIYAPATFSAGSSIAHVDEETYFAGDVNSLMSPQIGFAEVIHDPGPIALAMLNDLGWKGTLIQHNALANTENVSAPYEIKCTIKSDNGYVANSVKLNYAANGGTLTTVTMTPTGISNEYSTTLPSTGSSIKYSYFFSVTDNAKREYFRPGKTVLQGQTATQATFVFEAGPDTKAPKVVHDAKQFIVNTDTKLDIKAVVSDNIGVQSVKIEYLINDVAQSDIVMTPIDPKEDSVYAASINFSPLLNQGSAVKYRIKATDTSIAQNVATTPSSTTYYSLPVTGLLPVQDSYANNFNSATTDFFGDNLFSLQTASGFSNGALQTSHPYPNGTGPGNESNYVYQLKVPVRVKSKDAFIRFDEIVLVEPADAGAAFGSDKFFDYVIVEGSKDGGITWKKLLDGYNSRSQSAWLTKFNSAKDSEEQPNSTAVGDPSLYKAREIDLLGAGNFAAGDEVVIRFRLFADQLVHGWGWAIDNLRIQIDDVPPVVLHDHLNYQLKGNSVFKITTNATDANGLASLSVEYQVNSQPINTFNFPITPTLNEYTLEQTVTGITTGDVFKYRIRAKDPSGNEKIIPESGFFNVPVIEFKSPVTQYSSDFNSTNTDFVGNFFSIAQPTGFNDGAVHSSHPYPIGFGLTQTSNLIYLLKSPIIISDTNPYVSYDEEVLVETGSGVSADYVVVEASKDSGVTWEAVVNPYDASANNSWNTAFTSQSNGSASLLKNRVINLTASGKFKAGDQILIRFRLFSNSNTNGWGWAIDNLSIQGLVTGLENSNSELLKIFPNPVEDGRISVELKNIAQVAHLTFLNAQGQTLMKDQIQVQGKPLIKEYDVRWESGLYLLKMESEDQTVVRKFIVR